MCFCLRLCINSNKPASYISVLVLEHRICWYDLGISGPANLASLTENKSNLCLLAPFCVGLASDMMRFMWYSEGLRRCIQELEMSGCASG